MPPAVEEIRERAVLGHVHHEGVAVDVMADVAVVQPRHVRAVKLGALPLAVPVNREGMTIGVERWEQDHYHVAQRAHDFRILRCRQRVEQLGRGLRRADLGGVDAHAECHDHRLPRGQRHGRRFVDGSRIGQPQGVGANLFQACDILRSRHDRGD